VLSFVTAISHVHGIADFGVLCYIPATHIARFDSSEKSVRPSTRLTAGSGPSAAEFTLSDPEQVPTICVGTRRGGVEGCFCTIVLPDDPPDPA
jgi:hypothetical protein